jgi:sulfur carrier protein ThiS
MMITPDGEIPDTEIPLPPLPAAFDKDPEAMLDTRLPPPPSPPPPPKEKTEMEMMLEKHAEKEEAAEAEEYATATNGNVVPDEAAPAHAVAAPVFDAKASADDENMMDRMELEMLGIDPNDLAGFGN